MMFPFLSHYKLVNPYKRDYYNMIEFKKQVKTIISASQDKSSVGFKIFNSGIGTEEERLDDLWGVMIAGSETTAHSLVSCLYFFK